METLRGEGRRVTRQRRLVMEVLEQSRDHLDAETVYARAKARDTRISLATVYRALAVLKGMGLADGHSLGEDHAHFEAGRKSPHHHFTCLGCGKVFEFDAPEVNRMSRRLADQAGLRVTEAQVLLKGYCRDCQKRGA